MDTKVDGRRFERSMRFGGLGANLSDRDGLLVVNGPKIAYISYDATSRLVLSAEAFRGLYDRRVHRDRRYSRQRHSSP